MAVCIASITRSRRRSTPRSTLFPYTTLFRSDPVQFAATELAQAPRVALPVGGHDGGRSEEHTSELQSHSDLVCRLLLEKKKRISIIQVPPSTYWIVVDGVHDIKDPDW